MAEEEGGGGEQQYILLLNTLFQDTTFATLGWKQQHVQEMWFSSVGCFIDQEPAASAKLRENLAHPTNLSLNHFPVTEFSVHKFWSANFHMITFYLV